MPDAVLLDWEGVLADTGAARRTALLRALTDEGVPWTEAAFDDCCSGLDTHAAAGAALAIAARADHTLTELVALRASRAFAERLTSGFLLKPGASAFIAGLEHRARIAIVTRASRAETELALQLSGLAGSIRAVVTADDVHELPPAPALYTLALAHLARVRTLRAEDAVALVDTVPAARAARGAGLRVLAIGAPAHAALEADAAVDGLPGLTLDDIGRLTGPGAARRQP
jgi:beta-phosphoglucomutase-like phosphatase (HAD superfamily)